MDHAIQSPMPGSPAAIQQGCTCPVMDNHNGNRPDGNYWINGCCPIHGLKSDGAQSLNHKEARNE